MAGARIGQSLERCEDFALLTGRGRYADDLPVAAGTLHAAILRSPHAHAEILAIDTARAAAMPGVACVVTREDARRWGRPFIAAVKSPIEHWCLATNRVRYEGERSPSSSGPLSGRGCTRSYRRHLPSVACDCRSAAGTRCRQRPALPLRPPGSRLCHGAASDREYRGLPAQRLHADRVLRRRRGGRSPPPRSVVVDRSIDLDGAHGVGAGRRRQRRHVVGPVYAAAECSGQPVWCGRATAGI
jgi:hypothetical protein